MNKNHLASKYALKYRNAGYAGAEETNDQMAYKQVLIALNNNLTMLDARASVQSCLDACTDQDRREIYQAFLEETSK